MDCELCREEMTVFGDENAFVRYDNNSLSMSSRNHQHVAFCDQRVE